MKPKHRCHVSKEQPSTDQGQLHMMKLEVEALSVIQASFQTMEETIRRNSINPHPRLPFALEIVTQVKQKIVDLLREPGEMLLLDGNEVLIIRTSLQLYTIDLLCMQATPERNYLIAMCQQVAALLPRELPPPMRLND